MSIDVFWTMFQFLKIVLIIFVYFERKLLDSTVSTSTLVCTLKPKQKISSSDMWNV